MGRILAEIRELKLWRCAWNLFGLNIRLVGLGSSFHGSSSLKFYAAVHKPQERTQIFLVDTPFGLGGTKPVRSVSTAESNKLRQGRVIAEKIIEEWNFSYRKLIGEEEPNPEKAGFSAKTQQTPTGRRGRKATSE
jgi:hypothetical protein